MPKYHIKYFIEWGDDEAFFWATDDATREHFDIIPIPPEKILPPELVTRAKAIAAWYQTALDWEYPPDPWKWDQEECDRFRVAVRALFAEMQKAVGEDYMLVYEQIEPNANDRRGNQ